MQTFMMPGSDKIYYIINMTTSYGGTVVVEYSSKPNPAPYSTGLTFLHNIQILPNTE